MTRPLQVRDCLCLRTRRAARQITQFYDDALNGTGLRITQFLLLAAIEEAQPVGHQRLADILGMDRTTLTRNLALLDRDGLALIEKAKDDKRESQIRVTAAGGRAVAQAMPFWERAQQHLLDRLGSEPDPSTGRQALSLLDRIGRSAS